MMLENWSVVLLLIAGGLTVSKGSLDIYSKKNHKFIEALEKACSMYYHNKSADCTADWFQQDITAAANAKIVCRNDDGIVITQDPGIFVVERLSENGTTEDVDAHAKTWMDEEVKIGKVYRYQLYRVSSHGLSKPEVIIAPVQSINVPMPVTNLTVTPIVSNSSVPGTTSVEVSFNPGAGNTCSYRVICSQDGGDHIVYNDTLNHGVYEVRLDNLTLATNFTVIVEAKTWLRSKKSAQTSVPFMTRDRLTLPVRIPVENLTVTSIESNSSVPGTTNSVGKTVLPVNITVIASLVGAIVLTISIGIIVFAVHRFFRIRKRRPSQTELPQVEVDKFEIEPERLTTTRVLGSGAFGLVKLGSLRDYQGQTTTVAVKMLRDNTSLADLRNFGLEIEMLKTLGKHRNIISFVGCCTVGSHPFLVTEYCSRGDLQSFLRAFLLESMVSENETDELVSLSPMSSGPNNIPQTDSNASPTTDATAKAKIVTMMDTLNYGRQIATGMEFLSLNRIVHCDLATRNVLVCDDDIVKISDFGLGRDVYQENVYRKKGNGRMPLKWMAIEALTHQVFSTSSDVWSFGVLLWEIFTLGGDPYPGIPTIDILNFLNSGSRMERPARCSIPLYDVMLSCWHTSPKQRPSFTHLRQKLDQLVTVNANSEYLAVIDVPNQTSLENNYWQISPSYHNVNPVQKDSSNRLEPIIVQMQHGQATTEVSQSVGQYRSDHNSSRVAVDSLSGGLCEGVLAPT